jgi:hypothetical protein
VTTSHRPLHLDPPPPEPPPIPDPPLLRLYRHLSGPDTTRAEVAVQVAGTLGITAVALAVALGRSPEWNVLQWALAMGIAFDFAGGVVTNATTAAKRWFHRPGRGRARAAFYVGHVHPLVLPLVFSVGWVPATALYVGMLASVAVVERSPRAIAQPVAFGLVGAGLVLAGAASWPAGLEWFAPVYLLKLVGAHAVPHPE